MYWMLFLDPAAAQLSAGASKMRQDRELPLIQHSNEVFGVCVFSALINLDIWRKKEKTATTASTSYLLCCYRGCYLEYWFYRIFQHSFFSPPLGEAGSMKKRYWIMGTSWPHHKKLQINHSIRMIESQGSFHQSFLFLLLHTLDCCSKITICKRSSSWHNFASKLPCGHQPTWIDSLDSCCWVLLNWVVFPFGHWVIAWIRDDHITVSMLHLVWSSVISKGIVSF